MAIRSARRILDVGRDGHRRIQRYLRGVSLAQELPFRDHEYRIEGYCDVLVYIPPELWEDRVGFYCVEIETAGSRTFERIVDQGRPREDHAGQSMIYQWGVERHYGGRIPIRGGIVLYENRDSLEHQLFEADEEGMQQLLSQVEAI